jgi:hypothetical protein
MEDIMKYVFSGAVGLVGAGLFWYGFNRMHKLRIIQDTPTSKIRSMAMGLVEVHGNVLAKDYIITPFSQARCVYYRYEIKEYRQHTSRGPKGEVRTTYCWDTISRGEQRIPFWAKDETGQVCVNPTGAEFNVPVKRVFLQKAGLFGAVNLIVNSLKNWDNRKQVNLNVSSWGLIPLDPKSQGSFINRVGDRKYYEYFIEPDETLFVMGTAVNSGDIGGGNVLIKKGDNEPVFIISNKSEKELLSSLKWQMIGFFVFGGLLFLGGVVLMLHFSGVI